MNSLVVRNRQHRQRINSRLFRQILLALLLERLRLDAFDLAFYVVGSREMTRLNETFHRCRGSTDVLAFDYRESAGPETLRGEILLCVDEAKAQARRFHTTWPNELVRYAIHGVLHLRGHDDHAPAARRHMKTVENRLLDLLGQQFRLSKLGEY